MLTAPALTTASVVITQIEERSFFSLWLLSNHAQQSSAHQQIKDNHEIIVVPYFDEAALTGADMVYLSPSLDELKLAPGELDTLVAFVESGGRLVIPADYGVWADEFRAIAARFDVTYGDSYINGVITADVLDWDNPITNGVGGTVNQFVGSAVNDVLSSSHPDFRVIAQWQAGPSSIGYLQHGAGEVVFLSDFSTFDTDMFFQADNQILWTNLFEYANPSVLRLVTADSCPGPMRFTVTGGTPARKIAFVYAAGLGSVQVPPGYPCAGITLGLNATVSLAGVVEADGSGVAVLDAHIPSRVCGQVYVQAVDLETCQATNVILIE
ncbi:MAG: hypothetical protein D8M59_10305 [Planctomycetes bacterium]|nr:hypothetical protein [Planctomycetota bacterium]